MVEVNEKVLDEKYGCTGDTMKESDFVFGASFDLSMIEKPKSTFKKSRITYNQNLVEDNSCTIVATYGSISDYEGKEFSYDVMKEAILQAIPLGFDKTI